VLEEVVTQNQSEPSKSVLPCLLCCSVWDKHPQCASCCVTLLCNKLPPTQ
jgi:hypothetical protein